MGQVGFIVIGTAIAAVAIFTISAVGFMGTSGNRGSARRRDSTWPVQPGGLEQPGGDAVFPPNGARHGGTQHGGTHHGHGGGLFGGDHGGGGFFGGGHSGGGGDFGGGHVGGGHGH